MASSISGNKSWGISGRLDAKALILLGYSNARVAKELPVFFPDEPKLSSESTIDTWAREMRETMREEIQDSELRIARRMDQIVSTSLDKVEAGELKPSFSQIMLGWGLSHDKVFKSEEIKKLLSGGTTYNIYALIAQRREELEAEGPKLIEGESHEVTKEAAPKEDSPQSDVEN